jgi:hypothetical protein
MTTFAAIGGVLGAIALAGLARDRVSGRRRPVRSHRDGSAAATLRYHREVGDTTNQHFIVP